jgi:ribose-phosphate pyrophosphokinase
MVSINGVEIGLDCFPNNERIFKTDELRKALNVRDNYFMINFVYSYDGDITRLIMATEFLKDTFSNPKIDLIMRYIPYSRMDRKIEGYMFTLKYFCKLINKLEFNKVTVLDPHSNVSIALLDRCVEIDFNRYIKTIFGIKDIDYVFYPDNGACKRYSEILKLPNNTKYFYGNKKRDLQTGDIIEYELVDVPEDIKGKNVLIIDDLCSKGFTFYKSAEKLKEQGVNDVYLYVSHCENSIYQGELLKTDLISQIFTTDSILNNWEHKKLIKLD